MLGNLCLLLLLAAAGCAPPRVDQSLARALGTTARSVDFWHALANRPVACNDEMLHALLLWHDGRDDCADYRARVELLKHRNWLARGFAEPAEQGARRGALARALVGALKLRGGVTMRLLGYSERYALRELEYRQLMPASSPGQILTGAHLVGLIAAAQEFRTPSKLEHVSPASAATAMLAAEGDAPPGEFDDLTLSPTAGSASLYPQDAPAGLTDLTPLLAFAGAPATAPTEGALTAQVIKVEGDAQYRESPAADFKPLPPAPARPLLLRESASIRTGAAARVTLQVGADQQIVVGHLTTITVLRAVRKDGKATLNLGMEYGRTLIDVYDHRIEHQTTIQSPNAALAVRGTRVILADHAPFAPHAVSLTGRAEFAARRKNPVAFGSARGKTARINANAGSAAQVALDATVVDPALSQGRTPDEARFLQMVLGQGAVLSMDPVSSFPIARGGIPPSAAQVSSILPGPLSIVVTWKGNSNLDMRLSTPQFNGQSEFIYPIAAYSKSASGGRSAFDHQGGPSGGIEAIYWTHNTYPTGRFTLGVTWVSGTPATATVQVFRDRSPVPLLGEGQPAKTRNVNRQSGLVASFDLETSRPAMTTAPRRAR